MSPRVRAVTERYAAVTRALVRLGKSNLIADGVNEAELIRTFEARVEGMLFRDDIEARSIRHVAEHPHAYFMYCRRYPQRLIDLIEAETKNGSLPHTESRLISINEEGPIDNDYSTQLCG
jgi:hypothetical protein